MASLPPPPNSTPLAQKDGLTTTTWARWFQQLWDKQKLATTGGTGGGTLSDAAPADIGTTAEGIGTEASRADHVHAHGSQGGGSLHAAAVASGAAGFLSGTDKAKLDGVPASFVALTSDSPANVGTTAVGVAATAARADHVHAHGNLAGGSFHALAVSGVSAGFVSATDQSRIDGILTPGQILALARCFALP